LKTTATALVQKLAKNWSAIFRILDITVGVYFDKSNQFFL